MKWHDDDRWRRGENSPRCPLCRDAGWVKPPHERPWELRPKDTLVPCPCRHPKEEVSA